MKRIIILSTLLISFVASAGEWKEVSTSDEIAVTPFGIKKLMNNYKYRSFFKDIKSRALTRILVGESAGVIDEVKVTTRNLKWDGQTVCQPSDPRLKTKTYDSMVCWAGTNGCEAMGSAIIGQDPCL